MLNDRKGRVFWTLSAAHLVNDSDAFVLPALLPLLIPSLDISLTAAGLAVGLYQVTSSITQPVLGHLADRHPLRWLAWRSGRPRSGSGCRPGGRRSACRWRCRAC